MAGILVIRRTVAVFLLSVLSVTASGYEFDPEYRSFASQLGFRMIDAYSIDSEYQSDLLTYEISPFESKALALARFSEKLAKGSFFVSAGSLSATQFDQKLRAEIVGQLSESTRVRFLRSEDGNYEENSSHSIVELEQRIFKLENGRAIFLAAYGELSRFKKEDDIGAAAVLRSTTSETRLFLTQADFTRSERNDSADRFESGHSPFVVGLVHRALIEEGYAELFLRKETPIRWNDPVMNQTFAYENRVIGGTWFVNAEDSSYALRAQWDSKSTSIESNAPASVRSIQRERFEFEARRMNRIESHWSSDIGLLLMTRTFQNEVDRKLFHENLLPFIWIKHDSGLEGGLETTLFRRWGEASLGSPNVRSNAEESRLNLRYRHLFEANAELRLALTFDLDGADSGAFEGGHGQFFLGF